MFPLFISDTTIFSTKCHVVVAGIIPSRDPTDACHYTMPNYIDLNSRLQNLVNMEQFRWRSSYLDIANEFIYASANAYSQDLVHLSPRGARHLASLIKGHVVGLLDQF